MVPIGYRLWSIGAVVVWGPGWLPGWAGCLAGLAAWLGWLPGRAGCLAVAAVSQIHRELIHGETGNCDPLWGLKPPLLERQFLGGLEAISW